MSTGASSSRAISTATSTPPWERATTTVSGVPSPASRAASRLPASRRSTKSVEAMFACGTKPVESGEMVSMVHLFSQVVVDGGGRAPARPHREDDGGRARGDVAACVDAGTARRPGLAIGDDAAVRVRRQARSRLRKKRIGIRAEGDDDEVRLDDGLGPWDDYRATSSALVGLGEPRPDALDPADPAVFVPDEARRQGQPFEDRALLDRPPVVLRARAHLVLAAPVHDA